jgi:tRNA modification GTPase
MPLDTIVAISTPPGRGGIGIVRLSGPQSFSIAHQLLQLSAPFEHARARFTHILDPHDPTAAIDDAIVTAFLAPHSYTADDLVEIAAHGSPVILQTLVEQSLTLGARLALPGEFTQRAFLSGRIDLTQAEAVHDLIAAQTLDQARVAAQQLGGAISRRVAPAKASLLHIIALLEAGMDFASGELDDVDIVPPEQIAAEIAVTRAPLSALAASFRHGVLVRSGASLALVGRPNAGKSSLFNRLLERNRAIVTPIAGTTRDTVEESLSLNGIPIRLIDTAGLRFHNDASDSPIDEAEQQGIARSHEALADADLVLFLHDATTELTPQEQSLLDQLTHRPHLIVANKIDLLPRSSTLPLSSFNPIPTSALTGEGLDDLRAAILHQLQAEGALADAGALNNLRQQQAVTAAIGTLDAATAANTAALPHELILLDLHNALRALDSLTGATTPDDILGLIFSTFCIGK